MSGEEAYGRIRMQNAGCWKPGSEDSRDLGPWHRLLTAAAKSEPPQAPQPLSKDTQLVDVARDRLDLEHWVLTLHTDACLRVRVNP